MYKIWRTIGLLFVLFFVSSTKAQNSNPGKLKVFIDCRVGCDLTYFKTEINIVDYVLNRVDADLYVLLNGQRMGGGGVEYTMNFFGQDKYQNYIDTLVFTTAPNATASKVRTIMLQYFMLGCSPLIAKTPYASKVKIDMKAAGAHDLSINENTTQDRWNYWVFNVAASGQFSADQVYKNSGLNSSISANRTTNKVKLGFSLNGNLSNSLYTYDTTQFRVKNSNYRLYHTLVNSFSDHWSYGYQTTISSSTFDNYKLKLSFNPTIEYNVYKYKEVNDRFFVFRYGFFVSHNDYYDTTIYNKMNETYFGHRFSGAITLNKIWGTFNGGMYYSNYFYDWSLYTMGINANTDVRIGSGLSFFVHLNASIVHNQINLVKGNISEQDLLTRQRQLGSTYNYFTSFGLAFRFGSILNNFVNPRFEGYGGF